MSAESPLREIANQLYLASEYDKQKLSSKSLKGRLLEIANTRDRESFETQCNALESEFSSKEYDVAKIIDDFKTKVSKYSFTDATKIVEKQNTLKLLGSLVSISDEYRGQLINKVQEKGSKKEQLDSDLRIRSTSPDREALQKFKDDASNILYDSDGTKKEEAEKIVDALASAAPVNRWTNKPELESLKRIEDPKEAEVESSTLAAAEAPSTTEPVKKKFDLKGEWDKLSKIIDNESENKEQKLSEALKPLLEIDKDAVLQLIRTKNEDNENLVESAKQQSINLERIRAEAELDLALALPEEQAKTHQEIAALAQEAIIQSIGWDDSVQSMDRIMGKLTREQQSFVIDQQIDSQPLLSAAEQDKALASHIESKAKEFDERDLKRAQSIARIEKIKSAKDEVAPNILAFTQTEDILPEHLEEAQRAALKNVPDLLNTLEKGDVENLMFLKSHQSNLMHYALHYDDLHAARAIHAKAKELGKSNEILTQKGMNIDPDDNSTAFKMPGEAKAKKIVDALLPEAETKKKKKADDKYTKLIPLIVEYRILSCKDFDVIQAELNHLILKTKDVKTYSEQLSKKIHRDEYDMKVVASVTKKPEDITKAQNILKQAAKNAGIENVAPREDHWARFNEAFTSKIVDALEKKVEESQIQSFLKHEFLMYREEGKKVHRKNREAIIAHFPKTKAEFEAHAAIAKAAQNAHIDMTHRSSGKDPRGVRFNNDLLESVSKSTDPKITEHLTLAFQLFKGANTVSEANRKMLAENIPQNENEGKAFSIVLSAWQDTKRTDPTKAIELYNQLKARIVSQVQEKSSAEEKIKEGIVAQLQANKELTKVDINEAELELEVPLTHEENLNAKLTRSSKPIYVRLLTNTRNHILTKDPELQTKSLDEQLLGFIKTDYYIDEYQNGNSGEVDNYKVSVQDEKKALEKQSKEAKLSEEDYKHLSSFVDKHQEETLASFRADSPDLLKRIKDAYRYEIIKTYIPKTDQELKNGTWHRKCQQMFNSKELRFPESYIDIIELEEFKKIISQNIEVGSIGDNNIKLIDPSVEAFNTALEKSAKQHQVSKIIKSARDRVLNKNVDRALQAKWEELIPGIEKALGEGVEPSVITDYIAEEANQHLTLTSKKYVAAVANKSKHYVKRSDLRALSTKLPQKCKDIQARNKQIDESFKELDGQEKKEFANQKLISSVLSEEFHLHTLEESIKAGADIKFTDTNKNTALHFAVENNHRAAIDVLIGAGANPSLANNDGNTALHLASMNGNVEAVRALIAAGADPSITNNKNETAQDLMPLDLDSMEIGEILASAVKEPESITLDRHDSVSSHSLSTSSEPDPTIDHVVSTSSSSDYVTQFTDLHEAIDSGGIKDLAALMRKEDTDKNKKKGKFTPIQYAISKSNTTAFKTLLDEGADLNVKDENGNNLVHLAATAEDSKFIIAELLKQKPALLNSLNAEGAPPLHLMLQNRKFDSVKWALNPEFHAFQVNPKTKKSYKDLPEYKEYLAEQLSEKLPELKTPKKSVFKFLKGVKYKSFSEIQKIKKLEARIIAKYSKVKPIAIAPNPDGDSAVSLHNANPIIQDKDGNSALHIAALNRDVLAVEALLANNVSTGVKSKKGLTAMQAFEMQIHSEHKTDPKLGRNGFHVAAANGKKEDLEILIQIASKSDKSFSDYLLSKDGEGKTPIELAQEAGHLELSEFLLFKIKDPDQKKALEMNLVPIQKHIIKGEKSEFEILLDKGEDLQVKDKNGNNLAHLAASSANAKFMLGELNKKAPELLLAKNRDGKTALDILEEKGKIKLARDFYFKLEQGKEGFRKQYPPLAELPKPRLKAKEYISIDDLTYREQMEARIIQQYSEHKLKPIKISEKDRVIQDEKGNSALHLASTKGDVDAVEFLLQHGADANIKDQLGHTPLQLAKKKYDSLFMQCVSDPKISNSLEKAELKKALMPMRKSGKIIALLQQETGAIEVTDSKKIYLTHTDKILLEIEKARDAKAQEVPAKAKEVAEYKNQSLENLKASLENAQKTGKYDEVAKFPAETLNEFEIPRVIRHKILEAKDELDKQFKKEWKKHNKGITKNNRTKFLDGDTKYYLGSGPMSGGTNKSKADPAVMRFNAKVSQLSSSEQSTSAPMQLVEKNLTKEEQTEWSKIEQASYDLVIKMANTSQSKDKKLTKEAKKVTKDVSNYLQTKLEESENLPEEQKKIRRAPDCLVTTNKLTRKTLIITNEDGSLKEAYKGAKVFMWRYDQNHKKIPNSGKNSKGGFEVDWVQFDKQGNVVGGNVGIPPEHSSLQDKFIEKIQDPKIAINQIKLKATEIGKDVAGEISTSPDKGDGPELSAKENHRDLAAEIGRGVSGSISTSPTASPPTSDKPQPAINQTLEGIAAGIVKTALEQGIQKSRTEPKPDTRGRTSTQWERSNTLFEKPRDENNKENPNRDKMKR